MTGQQGCGSPQSPAAPQGEGRRYPASGTWPSVGLAGGDKAVHWGVGVHGDAALNPHVSCQWWSSFVRYVALPGRLREISKPPVHPAGVLTLPRSFLTRRVFQLLRNSQREEVSLEFYSSFVVAVSCFQASDHVLPLFPVIVPC